MKCDELEFFFGGAASWAEVYKKSDVDEAIAELKKEIERCQRYHDAEAVKWLAATAKAETENNKLKRAMWIARANKAESEARGWHHSDAYMIKYDGLHNIKGVLYGKGFKRYPDEWIKLWIKIERLCLAKAEKFK